MYSLGISSQTPHKINYVGNFKKEDHKTFVTPTFSSVVYRVEVKPFDIRLFLIIKNINISRIYNGLSYYCFS